MGEMQQNHGEMSPNYGERMSNYGEMSQNLWGNNSASWGSETEYYGELSQQQSDSIPLVATSAEMINVNIPTLPPISRNQTFVIFFLSDLYLTINVQCMLNSSSCGLDSIKLLASRYHHIICFKQSSDYRLQGVKRIERKMVDLEMEVVQEARVGEEEVGRQGP